MSKYNFSNSHEFSQSTTQQIAMQAFIHEKLFELLSHLQLFFWVATCNKTRNFIHFNI